MPTTVICSWPSRLPRSVRPSEPELTAITSPCCTRALTMSMRPPRACNSRNRAGHGFGAKSASPRKVAETSASSGIGRDRMHLGRGGGGRAQADIDHRIVGGRAFRHAAMQLEPLGVENRRVAAGPLHLEIVEHQRAALRRARRAAHARLSERPVHDIGRRLARLGDRHRALELADQQSRLVDLRQHHQVGALEHELARPCRAAPRLGSVQRTSMRNGNPLIALRAAFIGAAGLRLARAPAGDGGLRRATRRRTRARSRSPPARPAAQTARTAIGGGGLRVVGSSMVTALLDPGYCGGGPRGASQALE